MRSPTRQAIRPAWSPMRASEGNWRIFGPR
jgi:hypothetical protein